MVVVFLPNVLHIKFMLNLTVLLQALLILLHCFEVVARKRAQQLALLFFACVANPHWVPGQTCLEIADTVHNQVQLFKVRWHP